MINKIIQILKEQKKKKDDAEKDTQVGHHWSEITLDGAPKQEEALVTEDELVNLVKAERKNSYNPYGKNRKIASSKERQATLSVDDVNGFGPKEYFKSLGLTEAKIFELRRNKK